MLGCTQGAAHQSSAAGACNATRANARHSLDQIVLAKWVVSTGGYQPMLVGISGTDIVSASHPADEPSAVDLQYDSSATQLLAEVTAQVTQQPLNSRLRRLTAFSGLDASDVQNWAVVGEKTMRPLAAGGKLLYDPILITTITDGVYRLSGLSPAVACTLLPSTRAGS